MSKLAELGRSKTAGDQSLRQVGGLEVVNVEEALAAGDVCARFPGSAPLGVRAGRDRRASRRRARRLARTLKC